jgi:hypothetical protein
MLRAELNRRMRPGGSELVAQLARDVAAARRLPRMLLCLAPPPADVEEAA